MRGVGQEDERIDLLEADRAVFVDSPPEGAKRSRQVLKAVGVVSVVAVVAVVWWPRSEKPEWREFQTAPIPAAGLSEELVFDEPSGQMVVADIAPAPEDFKPELGYVFVEPGGTILTGRWASFRTHETNSSAPQVATDGPLVGGVHADVRRAVDRHDIEWGPLNGRNWVVSTNHFTDYEALDFANHVGVIEGRASLAHRYGLGAMKPVGSIAALDCVVALASLLHGDRLLSPVMPTVLTWATASSGGERPTLQGATSLGSIPAPADALPLVEFVLGDGTPTTVHGQPAVAIPSKDLGPVVAWLEDGRLIVVMADLAVGELIALAESVRPATAGEWRVVGRTAVREIDYGFNLDQPESVTLHRVVDPDTGTVLTLTAQPIAGEPTVVFTCAEERDARGKGTFVLCDPTFLQDLPLLTFVAGNGRQYVLAVTERSGAEAELRLQLANGTVQVVPLEEVGPDLPGPVAAKLLPSNYVSIQLVIDGNVAIAMTRVD